jgi:hypothetical protein
MTVTKRKIREVESIVNKADNRKTAGKIYLPKDWIGKRVKTILLSLLIVMALMIMTYQQEVKAELTFKQKLYVDYVIQRIRQDLRDCNMVLDNQFKLNSTNSNLTKAEYLDSCDKALVITVTDWCNNVNENSTRFIQSGVCEDSRLSKYIYERNLWNRIP